jgi:hypothetical protein
MTPTPPKESPESPVTPSPSAAVFSGRALAGLAAVATALVAAVVIAPPTLAAGSSDGALADQRHLVESLREAFVGYWRSGDSSLSPDLKRIVDYWFRFHVIKAMITAVLLVVLVVLGVLLWKAFLKAGGLGLGRRVALASAGVLVTMLTLLSLAVVLANLQGAAAPFSSLLPMVRDGATGGEVTRTLDQIRQGLAAGDRSTPALHLMIGDFARYHVTFAVIAVIAVIAFISLSVLWWREFAKARSSDRRARRLYGSFGVLSGLLSLLAILSVVANTSAAANSAQVLLAFFDGGW